MLVKSEGIIISTIRFSETGIIAKIFTHSHGILSFYVKGVYARNAALKPSYFFPMTLVALDFYYYPNKNLLKIKELRPLIFTLSLDWNTTKSPLLVIVAELINRCVKEVEKNEPLFDFLRNFINLINTEKPDKNPNLLVFFMVHLSQYLGFFPQNNFSDQKCIFDLKSGNFVENELDSAFCLSPSESKWLSVILRSDIINSDKYILPGEIRKNLINHLIIYYQIHIEGFKGLRSLEIYRKVFDSQ